MARTAKKLIRMSRVVERVPYCASQIYRLIRRGDFPKPISRSAGGSTASFFVESEVDEWIEKLVADRDAPKQEKKARLDLAHEKARLTNRKKVAPASPSPATPDEDALEPAPILEISAAGQ
jgi:predicted DNA-binding transcriptional regulator AlpA